MAFLLDTLTCIYALKQNENVLQQLLSTAREDVLVSVITESELRTGAAKSSSPIKTLHLIENFLRPLTLIDFTSEDAIAYPSVRAKLERGVICQERPQRFLHQPAARNESTAPAKPFGRLDVVPASFATGSLSPPRLPAADTNFCSAILC